MNVNGSAPGTGRRIHNVIVFLAILGWSWIAPHEARAQGTTRIEETDPSIRYTGIWFSGSRSDLSGGTIVESNDSNGSASLTFNGTAVSWVGMKAPWGGIARVYLDGTLRATVDTYAPAEQAQVIMYSAGGLPDGSHTILIKVTGTWNPSGCCIWIVVDAFDVTSGGTGTGPKRGPKPPKDTSPPAVRITAPAGGATVSGAAPVSASVSDNVGVAGVQFFLDGSALGPEDTAAPYSITWDTGGASDGPHTLVAVARDAAGNRASSTPVTVTVDNGASPPAATRYEESSATLAPGTAWYGITSAGTGVAESGDYVVYASDAGATATFTFTGTGVSWIGFDCERCGIARVSLDGAVVMTVDTFAPNRPAASRAMYSASGLPPGSHTLVIVVTGAMNASSVGAFIVVDAFDVM